MSLSKIDAERVPPAGVTLRLPGGVREVAVLAYPVVLANLSMTAMGFVDSAMVGRLGATPLAAVGFSGIWLWTLVVTFFGLASGVQTFVAQADGAGRPQEAGSWTWQSIWVVTPPVVILSALVGLFAAPLLGLLGPSAELQRTSLLYVYPRLPGLVAVPIAMSMASFFRGMGDTHTPLWATVAANVVNAVLNYGLIFGRLGLPEWGIAGAAVGTAVAEWFQVAVLSVFFWRSALARRCGTRPVAPSMRLIRRFIRTSAPIGGQWLLGMGSYALFSTLIARMGDTSMAASQAFVVLLSLSFMQMSGISAGAATLMGRYIGARDLAAAHRSFWSGQKLAAMLAAIVALVFIVMPQTLLRIFTDDPEVLRLGGVLVRLGALFQVFDAFGIVAEGSLRGAGDTRWPFWVHMVLAWVFYLPVAYLFGVTLGGGLTGAWLGATLYVVLLSAALVWRFRSAAWEKIEI
ncbi:MAG: MATE family efflux transporter [Deltaproteobacteria bacterium]|nr:MATE family efflux transporter [Deltaproteobacteria bacterium]MBW2413672.1 MATE family efflux transporter [Deltaproteobacteria bacterium]